MIKRKKIIIEKNRMLLKAEAGLFKALKPAYCDLFLNFKSGVDFQQVNVQLEFWFFDFKNQLTALFKINLNKIAVVFGERLFENLFMQQEKKSSFLLLETKGYVDIFKDRILNWINAYALARATTISENLKDQVKQVLVDRFINGWGEERTIKEIEKYVAGEYVSLQRVARTEAHTAAAVGSDTAARATGIDMIKEWAAVEDSRTRPAHAEADGQRRNMDDTFNVGGAALMYPGDANGPAKQVINCRCTTLYRPVIDGEILI